MLLTCVSGRVEVFAALARCLTHSVSSFFNSFCRCGCLSAVSDFHFHRRNTNEVGGGSRWSDKNGEEPTRCCWGDPALKDQEDAGALGIRPDKYASLRAGGEVHVVIATEACTPPIRYLYARPAHLLTAELGGFSLNHCAFEE